MAKKEVGKPLEIIDEDMLEFTGGISKLKRSEVFGVIGQYLDDNDLFLENRNNFKPDDLIKALFKEIGFPTKSRMTRASLLKLFSNDARDVGLWDY